MSQSVANRILILDAGSQYAKLIDRMVHNLHVETDIAPLSIKATEVFRRYQLPAHDPQAISGVILSGGPASVYAANAPYFDENLLHSATHLPILGICYGLQLINRGHGGTVAPLTLREDGVTELTLSPETPSKLIYPTDSLNVLLTHGDSVTPTTIAFGLEATAFSEQGRIVAALESHYWRQYGFQFHPEVDLTPGGKTFLSRFLYEICGCNGTYTADDQLFRAVSTIQNRCGMDGHILALVSGGVDSSVLAALCARAVGTDHVHAIHIDNGFMRLNESDQVLTALQSLGVHVTRLNCEREFLEATAGLVDPEKKRHAIGDTFMRVSQAYEQNHLSQWSSQLYLAQGTLRPDLIESASLGVSTNACVIKTHHNDTALVRELRQRGRVLEPLSELHKDEVRALGERLGLPSALVWRQPFPGPGLAIRTLCAYGSDSLERDTGSRFLERALQLRQTVTNFNLNHHTEFQSALLPVRTVGVQGDARSYAGCACLFSSNDDGMINWELAFRLAVELPQKLPVNRVWMTWFADDLSRMTAVNQLWQTQATTLTKPVLNQLRLADSVVMTNLCEAGVDRDLAQVCTVSVPLDGRRGMAIRTMISTDFMTGRAAHPGVDTGMPFSLLDQIITQLFQDPTIGTVFYDLTSKPPATTECE